MEAMASRLTEVDTSDCYEVTESRPPVLRLRGAGKPERDTEDRFSQSEYIEIGEVSGGDMSSRHECISRPDQQVESLMSMYQDTTMKKMKTVLKVRCPPLQSAYHSQTNNLSP